MTGLILAVLTALVVSFLCSISEAALLSVSHAQAQGLGESRAGQILRRFKHEVDVPIAAILILNTTANTIGAALAGAGFVDVFGDEHLWVFSLGFTLAILLFSEIVPKTLGAVHTARFIVPVVYWVSLLVVCFGPGIWVSRQLTRAIRGERAPVTSLEEIRLLAELGKSEGALAERTAKMIDGAARLRELCAYDVMVPRTDAVIVSGKRSLEENLRVIAASGFSRFPYSRAGEADKIDGVILVRDLLFAVFERGIVPGPDATQNSMPELLDEVARDAVFVTESTMIEELLRRFQDKAHHMAIVVDEYGGTEGLVTLEDVLEEIVGEIQDENDRVNTLVVRRADGSLLCRGRAELRKVLDLIGESDTAESVSVGGYIAERLGRVPAVGDEVRLGEHVFSVRRATARRAERISVDKKPSSAVSDA